MPIQRVDELPDDNPVYDQLVAETFDPRDWGNVPTYNGQCRPTPVKRVKAPAWWKRS